MRLRKQAKTRPAKCRKCGCPRPGAKHGPAHLPPRPEAGKLDPPKPDPGPHNIVHRLIALALDEVGFHEGKTGGHWNNRTKYAGEVPGLAWADGQPWCAVFVSWLALVGGAAELFPRTASCDAGAAWFRERGQWSEYPAIGAQVFYGTPADLNHTGFVIDFDADTITTVEGNTNVTGSREGDGVYRKVRRRRDAHVVGYGYPKYPGGIKAAR